MWRRYKFYLENEDDEEVGSEMETEQLEGGAGAAQQAGEEKENLVPTASTKRKLSSVRMGTKVSNHALTR